MQLGKIWLVFELIPGHIGKSIRPKGFESIKLTFRYENGGQSDYRSIPQDPLILAFSMEFTILLHGIGII